MEYRGEEIVAKNPDEAIMISSNGIEAISPFANFFTLEEWIIELEDMREEYNLFEDLCPLDQYLPIAKAHGQVRISIGISMKTPKIFI